MANPKTVVTDNPENDPDDWTTGDEPMTGAQRSYLKTLSDPPTAHERLQLIAARLEQRPIVVMPHKCATVDEWISRCGSLTDR
jgi:hypothetical protein